MLLINVEPLQDVGPNVGPPWISELMDAFRKSQSRDLAALAAARANIRLETVKGSYGLLFEQPAKPRLHSSSSPRPDRRPAGCHRGLAGLL